MEASCAPRSDAERRDCWSAARRGVLVSVGCCGGRKVGLQWPADAVAAAEESKRASFGTGPSGHLRARDAGVVGFSSDPSWNTDQGV